MEILMNLEIVFGPLCVCLPKNSCRRQLMRDRRGRPKRRERNRERERERDKGGGSYGKLAVNCCCRWHRLSKVVAFIVRFLLYVCVCGCLCVWLCGFNCASVCVRVFFLSKTIKQIFIFLRCFHFLQNILRLLEMVQSGWG